MISIKFNGKSLKQWWEQSLREAFVRKEVRPGRIMIVWQDVDHMVYGWNMSADEELGLGMVAAKIAEAKRTKLIHIINGKKGGTSNVKG